MPRHDNIWDEIIPVRWGLVVGSTHGEGIPTTLVAQGRELDVHQCGSTNLRTNFLCYKKQGQDKNKTSRGALKTAVGHDWAGAGTLWY